MSGEKRLTLKNRKEEALCIVLREYRCGDEAGMIDCIRDEYGSTYAKTEWYSKAAIMENAAKGRAVFIIAQTPKGEIVGTTAFVKTDGKTRTVYEIAAQVVKKTYRGYKIALNIFQYGLELLQNRDYAAVYSQPVLFHDITQNLLGGLGFKAVGIMPGMFDLQVLHHSYDNGRNTKMPLGIQVRAKERQNAGRFYLPKQHKDFCMEQYEKLGVECEAVGSLTDDREKMPARSSFFYQYDRIHKYLEISMIAIGTDWERQLKLLLQAYPLKGKNTANLFLNIKDQYAASVYNRLTDKGFFFTGIKPLCGDSEYMILHHKGETSFYLKDLKLNREFIKIADYIREENRYECFREGLYTGTKTNNI